MKMEKDIADIVTEKEYIELSQAERDELKEFCSSEDEYIQLKNVFLSVAEMNPVKMAPHEETKKSLDQLFSQTYPKASPIWYSSVLTVIVPKHKPIQRQPLVYAAAIALLFFLVVPLMNSDVTAVKTQLAKVDKKSEMKNAEAEVVEKEATEVLSGEQSQANSSLDTRSGNDITSIEQPISVFDEMTTSDFEGFAGAAATGSSHPDGVFMASVSSFAVSMPASESTDLLDLLTATF